MVWPIIAAAAEAAAPFVARKLAAEGAKKVFAEGAKQAIGTTARKAAIEEAKQAARAEAMEGAATTMEGGVPITRYPAVKEIEQGVTADITKGALRNPKARDYTRLLSDEFKKGGKVKAKNKTKVSSKASSASKRGDGIAQRGKTRGRMI